MHPLWPPYVAEVVPGLRARLVQDRLGALVDGLALAVMVDRLLSATRPHIQAWADGLDDHDLAEIAAELGLCLSFRAWQAARAGRAG